MESLVNPYEEGAMEEHLERQREQAELAAEYAPEPPDWENDAYVDWADDIAQIRDLEGADL
jgi:hypothetical protein